MTRALLILLALSVPAQAGDPAQYNLVQSSPVACFNGHPCHAVMVDDPPIPPSGAGVLSKSEQSQLDRIEQMLRAICSAYAVRLENATGTLAGCPKEPKP